MANLKYISTEIIEKNLKNAGAGKTAQRRTAPTFAMDDGEPTGYYPAASEYYTNWGYRTPIKVKSMEDMFDKMLRLGSIDHVRIISHGSIESSVQELELPVLGKRGTHPSTGTGKTESDTLLLGNPAVYVADALDDITKLFGPHGMTRLAEREGEGYGTPLVSLSEPTRTEARVAARAAGLLTPDPRTVAESGKYETSAYRTTVASIGVLALIKAYREKNSEKAKPSITEADLRWLENIFADFNRGAVEKTIAPGQKSTADFFTIFQEAATDKANGTSEDDLRRLLSNLIAAKKHLANAHREGAGGEGTFYDKLRRVREKLKSNSEIELRACNVGRDQTFMNRLQDLFAIPGGRAPAVSAPTLYQTFTRMAVTKFDRPRDFDAGTAKETSVSTGLLNNDFIINMSSDKRELNAILGDFYRGRLDQKKSKEKVGKLKRSLIPSTESLKKYNPDLNLQEIPGFGVIWLRKATTAERSAVQPPMIDPNKEPEVTAKVEGRSLLMKRTGKSHQLLALEPQALNLVEQWVRKVLLEDPNTHTKLTAGFEIMYLSPQRMGDDLATGKPVIFPGYASFDRHINYTPGHQ